MFSFFNKKEKKYDIRESSLTEDIDKLYKGAKQYIFDAS
jgi:hypothetical protein